MYIGKGAGEEEEEEGADRRPAVLALTNQWIAVRATPPFLSRLEKRRERVSKDRAG